MMMMMSTVDSTTPVTCVAKSYRRIKQRNGQYKFVERPMRVGKRAKASALKHESALSVAVTVVKPFEKRVRISVLRKAFALSNRLRFAEETPLLRCIDEMFSQALVCNAKCEHCGACHQRPAHHTVAEEQCPSCLSKAKHDMETYIADTMRPEERELWALYGRLRASSAIFLHGALGAFEARYMNSDSYMNLLPRDVFDMMLAYCKHTPDGGL